ncbi:hypothetical protein [Natronosalvus amylolyticus]|uniref:hypothetical protein n=1 Tax=Natronosalvus amylolyticus TaxID=2961994 RepID=UPI0020C99FE5|nr:hypothetical protein [Natronosalvus amylolyticus]
MSENFTLQVHDRRDLRRALDRLSLEHDDLWDADSCDIGEAIVRLALDNPDLLLQKLGQVAGENNSAVLEGSDAHLPTGDSNE